MNMRSHVVVASRFPNLLLAIVVLVLKGIIIAFPVRTFDFDPDGGVKLNKMLK